MIIDYNHYDSMVISYDPNQSLHESNIATLRNMGIVEDADYTVARGRKYSDSLWNNNHLHFFEQETYTLAKIALS